MVDAPIVDRSKEWKTRRDVQAECLTGGWKCFARNAHGAAAKHARKHVHSVRVEIAFVCIYDHGDHYSKLRGT